MWCDIFSEKFKNVIQKKATENIPLGLFAFCSSVINTLLYLKITYALRKLEPHEEVPWLI